MASTRKALSILFNDGSSVAFDFPTQLEYMGNITRRMEDLLKDQYIMIEVEGALVLYPLYNVRSIQVFPAPSTLPDHCIRGAAIAV